VRLRCVGRVSDDGDRVRARHRSGDGGATACTATRQYSQRRKSQRYLSCRFSPRIDETISIKIIAAKIIPRHWSSGRWASQFGFLSNFGSNHAEAGGVVMVSVELTEALPGVIEVGLRTHVGVGAGPFTEQLS
jgi:hypothetical protein